MYSVVLTELAAHLLQSIEAKARNQIIAKIEQLKEAPDLLGKPLVGPLREFRSIRAAGQRFRIIYRIQEQKLVVVVVAVGIRKAGDKKDIYELMKKLAKSRLIE